MFCKPPINEGCQLDFPNHLILLFFKDNFYKVNLKKSKFFYRGLQSLILKIDFKTVFKTYLRLPNGSSYLNTEKFDKKVFNKKYCLSKKGLYICLSLKNNYHEIYNLQ
jgi:hypothetical protein